MYPRQSSTTHTERLGDEASVYDWARLRVHALNPTAAHVWRHCDGATSADAIAAALRSEMGVVEADAVVDLTLAQLARLHLLELPVEPRSDRPAITRRWLIGRGVAAAMLPAIYSIVAPSAVEAQSPGPGVPTLSSLSPNQGLRGATVGVTLTGTNLVAGATTVAVSGGGVTVTNVTVSTSTSLTATFVIDAAAVTGPRAVTVITPAGTSTAQTFTINPVPAAAPTLTSIAPTQGTRGTTVAVTLTGTNFIVGATTVTVGGSGVTVTSVIVGSETSLTANLVLDLTAAVGLRTVNVTTAAGTSTARTFLISLPAPGAPTLNSVTPSQGIQGATVAVTLTGAGFVPGATTVAVGGGGVTVASVVVRSGTSLTASLVLDPAAADGARPVTVTTAAGTSAAQTFTVLLPPPPGTPTLATVSPNQGVRGTTVAITLTGTNFIAGATTIGVLGSGVTVTNVSVSGATSLTANFVLDPAAAEGPRIVTVTNAGGTSGPQAFTIDVAAPTLTSVAPNQGRPGTTVGVTLTGTDFVAGDTTVSVSGAGVTVGNIVVSSGTSLTASLVLDPAAAPGARSVTVATTSGTSGGQTFTIGPPPGSATFAFTGAAQGFTVPAGVVAITIQATGARGGKGGFDPVLGGPGGLGGRTTATVAVAPGASLTVRVGGIPVGFVGGFNGGGGSTGIGGGGGGASDVYQGATPLVIAGGGGGGGSESGGRGNVEGGSGGGGGGLTGGPGGAVIDGGGGGGGGAQAAGGAGGSQSAASLSSTPGTPGTAGQGGVGGAHQPGVIGGGGGGGGSFGGGGGGGGSSNNGAGGGGGGSSFAALIATDVVHEQGVNSGSASVTISW